MPGSKLRSTSRIVVGAIILALAFVSGRSVAAEKDAKHEELTFGEVIAGETKHEHKISKTGKTYSGNPVSIERGAEHYHKFNCVGCHFDGGGGIGPALIDDDWIYGSSIDHIAASIRQGRPNGMPSFHSILTEEQIWQLAAYIEDGLKEHPHGEEGEGHEHGDDGGEQKGRVDGQSKTEGEPADHHH